jgi:hypothetical protein
MRPRLSAQSSINLHKPSWISGLESAGERELLNSFAGEDSIELVDGMGAIEFSEE